MKRQTILCTIPIIMAVQSVAFADFTDPAWYTGDTRNKVEVGTSGICTVLITKESENNKIVYVNQADDVFDGSIPFLLKENPEIGKYTVGLGSENGLKRETYLYVGADSNNSNDLYMKRLQEEEQNEDNQTWNIGYYATVNETQYGNYTYLKVGYKEGDDTKYGSFLLRDGDYTSYSGEGDIYLIFQINNVPTAYKDSVAVYMSTDDGLSSQGGDN